MNIFLLFLIVVVVVLYFAMQNNLGGEVKSSAGQAKDAKKKGGGYAGLPFGGKSIMTPIPSGYQIYQDRLLVAGLSFKKKDVAKFIASENHTLELRRDPGNSYDKNAIEVIGKCDAGAFTLGYVEAPLAKYVVDRSLEDVVKPRLMRTYVGRDDYLEVMYQLIGPKSEKHRYDAE